MPDRDKRPLPLDYCPPPRPTIPVYRKILAGLLVGAGLGLLVVALFARNESARVHILVAGGGMAIWGLVVLFQHVRL